MNDAAGPEITEDGAADDGSTSGSIPTPGTVEVETDHDGLRRAYVVYTPTGVGSESALVMFLHGAQGSMNNIGQTAEDWFDLADEHGFVLVLPNGSNAQDGDGLGDSQVWNPAADGGGGADDVGFVLHVIDEVAAEYGVDPDDVYISGRSAGAILAMRAVLEHPDRFRAAAVFLGSLFGDVDPVADGPAPPVMMLNGTEDRLIPYDGGRGGRSAPDTAAVFVEATGSDPEPADVVTLPDLDPDDGCTIERQTHEVAGAEAPGVVIYTARGGGHSVPDPDAEYSEGELRVRGPVCRDANGIDLAWDFFSSVEGG